MAVHTDPVVDRAREGEISETVVTSVAAAKGVDPRDLETLLYDVVDPDALDRLFRNGNGEWDCSGVGHVAFRLAGCHVLVRDTGHVVVTRNGASPEP